MCSVGPRREPVVDALGERVRVADVRARAAEQRALGLLGDRGRRARSARQPARRRQRDARRQVLLLARPVGGVGGNERIGRHDRERYSAARPVASARSRPKWIESSRACQDASMMFSFTPIVVQVASPSVESISTRVTAPVPLLRVEHAHLVVGEVHPLERREACR